MGIAAYNRGSRAISRYITEKLRSSRVIVAPVKPVCDHLESRCKATRHGWNKNRWCDECRTWFWHGDTQPATPKPMSDRKTPRTDEKKFEVWWDHNVAHYRVSIPNFNRADVVPADFARALERECSKTRDLLNDILDAYVHRFGHGRGGLFGPIDPEIERALAERQKGEG